VLRILPIKTEALTRKPVPSLNKGRITFVSLAGVCRVAAAVHGAYGTFLPFVVHLPEIELLSPSQPKKYSYFVSKPPDSSSLHYPLEMKNSVSSGYNVQHLRY